MKTDTQKLHELISSNNWYEAAILLLNYCHFRDEDPQNWLADGDYRHMASRSIEELAAEWDDQVRLANYTVLDDEE